ncbi:MAG TPA: hypothetical protein VND24_02875 [Steroidobacteraceae bacterium]|nr:hypothetical protein [Steroidobacteraceae bacterium]
MTDTAPPPSPLAGFRGPVACRHTDNALILTGSSADSADDILILTFTAPEPSGLPGSLSAAAVFALGGRHYRIACGSRDWMIEAGSLHVHRDIGRAFYRAIPPRPAPLAKRLFWRIVIALAGSRAGKRLVLSLRRGR